MTGGLVSWARRQAGSLAIGALVAAIVLLLPPLTTSSAEGEGLMAASCRPVACPAPGSTMGYHYESVIEWTPPPNAWRVAVGSMVVGSGLGLVAGIRRGVGGVVGAVALGATLALLLGHVLQPGSPLTVPEGERVLDGNVDGTLHLLMAQGPLMGDEWHDAADEALVLGTTTALAHALLVTRPARPWPWSRAGPS